MDPILQAAPGQALADAAFKGDIATIESLVASGLSPSLKDKVRAGG